MNEQEISRLVESVMGSINSKSDCNGEKHHKCTCLRDITLDMAITYHASKDFSIYAKGYNLFNEVYAEQAGVTNESYRYPAQSRRFIVGAEYIF